MKKSILILSAAALLMAGCDKISPDDYTQSAGGGSNWTNANVHRAFVEKYTGPKSERLQPALFAIRRRHQRTAGSLPQPRDETIHGQHERNRVRH